MRSCGEIMKKKKLNLTKDLGEVCIEGSIESAIEELKSMKEEFEAEYNNLYVEVETYQLPYDSWTYARVVLSGNREETDDEYEARLLKEKKFKDRKEEQEKKELARLQKLYEKKK
jgi:hypothetical protein